MKQTLAIIDKMSKSAAFIAVAFLLFGLRVWGDDYSHSSRVIADAEAEQKRALTLAVEGLMRNERYNAHGDQMILEQIAELRAIVEEIKRGK